MRLQRFLSSAGVAARRKAERLIADGRVQVNGKVVTELGTRVDSDRDRVAVDGAEVRPEELWYVVLNKPKGVITAVSDPQGRPTVMEYVPGVPVKVAPVGRLDFYSEGVLLLTNDGELAAALTSPQRHVEKTYHVKLRGSISERDLARLRRGVRLDDGVVTKPALVDRLPSAKSRHDWLIITLTEGKSRQIHRMAEAIGASVQKIQRVAFAGISYHGLRVGDARELTQAEVRSLRDAAGLARDPRAVARGVWSVRREETEAARRARARARNSDVDARGERRPRRGNAGSPRRGDAGSPRRGDAGSPRRGDAGSPRRGDAGSPRRGADRPRRADEERNRRHAGKSTRTAGRTRPRARRR